MNHGSHGWCVTIKLGAGSNFSCLTMPYVLWAERPLALQDQSQHLQLREVIFRFWALFDPWPLYHTITVFYTQQLQNRQCQRFMFHF